MISTASLTFGFLAAAALATAQTATPPDAARFNTEVVVTPERGEVPRAQTPAATDVLSQADIVALPVVHPSELVSFLPGFTIMQGQFYAGRPVMSARGFFGGGEAEYVLLLVDGVPVSDIESGLIDWSVVLSSSIRRVEALRGPGASMYGDAAVGGVIQIFTERPMQTGQLTLTGGSFNSYTADGSYGRRAGRVSLTLSGAARYTGGAFEHSQGDQFIGGGSVEGAAGGLIWRWTGSAERKNRDDPGSATTNALEADPRVSDPAFRFDNTNRRAFSTALSLRHTSLAWQPQARVYVGGRDEDQIRTILLAPRLTDTQERVLSSLAVGGSFESEHTFGGAGRPVLHLGVDLAHEHLDTHYDAVTATGVVGAPQPALVGARIRAGLFTSGSYEPVRRVRLTGALRWDDVDDGGFAATSGLLPQQTAWSPRGGAVVQLSESRSVSAFAQVSRAFKAPTLDQKFDPRPYPDFRGGTFSISNPMLTPQRATNVEAGVTGGGAVRWNAVVYRMIVDNEIDFDAQTFKYVNIGRSRHLGAEFDAEGRWWKRVRPFASYAYTRVNDLTSADTDLQLVNIPRHVVSAGAAADLPWRISAFARVHHTAGAFLDDTNTLPIDGPSSLDLRVRRAVGRHVLFLDIVNAANDTYAEYGYTLTSFQGQVVPYAYAGAQRAVRAGLTISF